MKTKQFPAILFFAIAAIGANAQYLMPQSGNQTFNTCGGMFYDSGGVGNYSNNESGVLVLCSALPGQYVAMTFTSMALSDASDILRLYSGTGTGGPLLQTFQGPLNTTSFCAAVVSQDSSGGCLTAQFTSNSSGVAAGWNAMLSCNPTPSVVAAGATCAYPVMIPSIPYSVTSHCTQCMINDYQGQGGICNTTYAGEDRVYMYTTTGPETDCISMSNTTGNPALAIYMGCPGAGGICVTPTPIVGNSSMQFTFPSAATYYIIIDEASGYSCYDLSISPCTGIEEANSNNTFFISPNPASGKFIVEMRGMLKQVQHDISVYDVMGAIVYERKIISQKTEINLSEQPAGIYFVQVRNEKQTLTKRIVLQK
ncbi:MAG TPA: T9SS type A sorting domain-containing protein [Bacteroidia bacterium]|nr:T9SS type A sorting domain-containing protein [Bacteroidia bacterium]